MPTPPFSPILILTLTFLLAARLSGQHPSFLNTQLEYWSSPSSSPSPSSFPSPATPLSAPPAHRNSLLPPTCEDGLAGCTTHPSLQPSPPLDCTNGCGDGPRLNSGEKVGLVFLGAVVLLQVLLGCFLIYQRRRLWTVVARIENVPSSRRHGVPLAVP